LQFFDLSCHHSASATDLVGLSDQHFGADYQQPDFILQFFGVVVHTLQDATDPMCTM